MADQTRAFKKLTTASGFIRFASILCFVLSAIAVALEPISKLIYNMIFKNKVSYIIVNNYKSYFAGFQPAITMCVLSLILIIAAFSSKNKKNIGQGFSAVFVLVPLAASAGPTVGMIDFLKSPLFENYMKGADNFKFRGISILLVYAIPLFVAFMLFICGLILTCKCMSEKVRIEVPYIAPKVKAPKPVAPQMPVQPQMQMMPPQGMPAAQPNSNMMFGAVQQNAPAPSAPVMQPAGQVPDIDEPVTVSGEDEKPVIPETPSESAPAGVKICPNCGIELSGTAKFCKVCGTPLN